MVVEKSITYTYYLSCNLSHFNYYEYNMLTLATVLYMFCYYLFNNSSLQNTMLVVLILSYIFSLPKQHSNNHSRI